MFNGVMVKSFHFYWMHFLDASVQNTKLQTLKGSDQGIKPRRCGCRSRDFIEINGPEKIVPKNFVQKLTLRGKHPMFVKKTHFCAKMCGQRALMITG